MMEIAEKYKQTEVGLIPQDWEVVSLGEVFEFKNGLNKEKQFFGKGTPIVNYMDVFKNNGLKSGDLSGRVTLSPQEIKNFDVRKGDVFFTRTSETVEEIGISAVMLEDVKNTVFSGFVLRARPTNDKLDLEFKKYCFSTKEVRKEITSKSSYTTRALTNGRLLSAVKLAIPPTKAEQTAIATALSDADALISSVEKLIAKKRNIKQGAMQKLLQSKEGWEVKKLGEVGECHRGVSYNPERDLHQHDKDTTIRLLRSNNVQNQNIDLNGLQFVDQEKVKLNQILQDNDIVICMANGSKQLVDKAAIYRKKDNLKYTFGAFMGCFRTNVDLASSSYIAINFQSFQYRNYIDVLLSGSSINNLNPGNIESIEIPFPSPEEQTRIATILSDMDAEIAALETKLEKYRKVKLGMMQNLLTGKIRLI